MAGEPFEKARQAAAPARQAIQEAQPLVFNVYAEAQAGINGITTLNDSQNNRYQTLKRMCQKAGGGGKSSVSYDEKKYNEFINALKELNKLPAEDRAMIAGRLLYNGAHRDPAGANLIADVLHYVDGAKDMTFKTRNGQSQKLFDLLETGMIVDANNEHNQLYGIPKWYEEIGLVKDALIKLEKNDPQNRQSQFRRPSPVHQH